MRNRRLQLNNSFVVVALLIAATIAFAELFIRLPIIKTAREISAAAAKSMTTIRAGKISDHWKEQALPAYAGKMFAQTARLALLITAAAAPAIIILGVGQAFSLDAFAFAMSGPGIGVSLAAAFIFIFVRNKFSHH